MITPKARKAIDMAIDALFERAKARLLGLGSVKRESLGGKSLAFSFTPDFTIGALFTAASREEGAQNVSADLLAGLMKISESYLEAQKEKTKAQVIQKVQTFLDDAKATGKEANIDEVLGGELSDLWGKVNSDVRKIVETETTIARNVGADDAIRRISAMQGIDDPSVIFIVVRDGHRCDECTRLHLMPDKVTPRVWKRSQVSSGYHKKGSDFPSVGGLHPHCRCQISVLAPGFGFDKAGMVVWKAPGWDEYAAQQK